jgi:hypothetical protein
MGQSEVFYLEETVMRAGQSVPERKDPMRNISFVVAVVVWAGLGLAQIGAAQTAAPPIILNVTMDAAGDQLTITGKGFGPAPLVTIDGQPVTVLLGSTDTQVTVITPAVLLTTPGSYRLTVVDSVRQVGDGFVVASHAGIIAPVGEIPGETPTAATGGATRLTAQPATGLAAFTAPPPLDGVRQLVMEEGIPPYRTALGYQALSCCLGYYNTAIGYRALWNTTGAGNTATGFDALYSNASGNKNTASGYEALYYNATGHFNTAFGDSAGYKATGGSYNVFLGAEVLGSAADTNMIRIGFPYDGTTNPPSGQNQTFIAGIYGTPITGGFPVVINANGQLGIAAVPVPFNGPPGGSGTQPPATVAQLQQQVRDQQTTIADQGARLARLEALVGSSAGRK